MMIMMMMNWEGMNSIGLILRHCAGICLEGLMETTSIKIVDVPSEIRIRYIPNTSQKRYSLNRITQLHGTHNAEEHTIYRQLPVDEMRLPQT
jgi:hypothetical protein